MQLNKNILKKVKGGILLEPLVAIVIISGVLTYASFTMNNIFMGENSYLKFKALIELEAIIANNTDFENETFNYSTYSIVKEVEPSDLVSDVIEITWEIKEEKTNRTLGTIKELKNNE